MSDGLQTTEAARRSVNLLLVEDDDIDARIVEKIVDLLSGLDAHLTRVRDISHARKALQRIPFDVCLLDFWLEHESTARLLCELEENQHIGTILLSNISPFEASKLRLAGGRTQFLSKGDFSAQKLELAVFGAIAQNIMLQAAPSKH
jgi:DNA-binding NtrC family response regulator